MASRIKAMCKCLKHEEISENKDFKVYKHTAKKLKKATYDTMMKLNLITKLESALCTACVTYVENEGNNDDNVKKFKKSDKDVESVLFKIKQGKPDKAETETIISALAENEQKEINNTINDYKNLYKDDTFLENMTMDSILDRCNSTLIFFILCLCNAHQGLDAQRKGILIKIIELIYLLFSGSIVAPFHFAENMLIYFLTGSKTVCNMVNKYSPSGSYSTIGNWLKNRAVGDIAASKNDFICFFDNNQILSRNWRVKYNSKYSVNVITTVVYIVPDPASTIQTSVNLSPFYWLAFNNSETLSNIIKHENDLFSVTFSEYRDTFINHVIQIVDGSLDINFQDNTDKLNGHIFDKKCISETVQYSEEGVEFANSGFKFDPYDIVPEGCLDKPVVHVGDPHMLNPCSYSAVESLLDNIMEENKEKEWFILGCDGSPYLLAARMIENYALCPVCEETLKSEVLFQQHINATHNDPTISFNTNRKFKNILLIPRLGHFEINFTKAIFKLMWKVCLEDMAKMLGFTSTKALTHCQAATNHHQSWQMLQILLHGTAAELIVPFVIYCRNNNIKKDATQYFEYLKRTIDPCYKFMAVAIFTYVLAIHLFRCGVRKNNGKVKAACRWKAAPLFYGLNMT